MNPEAYFNKWGLTHRKKLATTHTSDVYEVEGSGGEPLILKCLNETGRADEAGGGALLKWYGGKGAVNLVAADDGAHLLEYAEGEELAALVAQGRDEAATQIICDVTKALHQGSEAPAPKTLVPLREWFRDLFQAAEKSNDDTVRLAAKVADALFSTTTGVIPLHGDLHHHNIIESQRGWLAIDPKGLIGDPCYDLANFYGNPVGMHDLWFDTGRAAMLTDSFVQALGYPRDRLIKFAFVHNVISSIWSGCSAVDGAASVRVAKLVYAQL